MPSAFPMAAAISTGVSSSPARETSRPIHSFGRENASAATAPTSSTAMNCCGTSGASPVDRFPFRSTYPPAKFSMKGTGCRIIAGRPRAAMRCSMRHLLTRLRCGLSTDQAEADALGVYAESCETTVVHYTPVP